VQLVTEGGLSIPEVGADYRLRLRPGRDANDLHGCGADIPERWVWDCVDSETRSRRAKTIAHLLLSLTASPIIPKLKDIPGIVPQKKYKGTGRSTYWRYAVSYHKEHFNNASLTQSPKLSGQKAFQ